MPAMLIPSFFITDDQQARMIFLGMFILIGVTDKLDGTIARYLNINENDFISIQSMFVRDTHSNYKILEVSPSATDGEIKKASECRKSSFVRVRCFI